jgi:hypothetical protein
MKKKQLETLLLALMCVSANISIFSQGNNHWHLGSNGLGIHFDGGSIPSITMDGHTPYGWSGCGILNNRTHGNLVFYSDGQKVIDRNHQIMPNGSGLFSGNSTHGTGKICSKPGAAGQYYVFSIQTATETSSIGSLYYSVVDTLLAGNGTNEAPLGDIPSGMKNIWIRDNVSESFEIIRGETDQIWLISPRFYESVIDVFFVNSEGITLSNSFGYVGAMQDVQAIKYSPASGKFALGSFGEDDPLLLFDFDITNGVISFFSEVEGSFGTSSNQYSGIIDFEWSPDGSKLYISKYRGNMPASGGKLFQYDLSNPNQEAVLLHQISTNISYVSKGLRLGPDGIIYWLYVDGNTGTTQNIAGIMNPNEAGLNCNLNLSYLYSNTNLNYTNLFPNAAVEVEPESIPWQCTTNLSIEQNCSAMLPDYSTELPNCLNCVIPDFVSYNQIPPAGSIITSDTLVELITYDAIGNFSSCFLQVLLNPYHEYDSIPEAFEAGADLEGCPESLFMMGAVELPEGIMGHWNVTEGYGFIYDESSYNTLMEGFMPGVNTIEWIVEGNDCITYHDAITITIADECPLAGDYNLDGVVTIEEFNTLLGYYGCVGELCVAYDLDGDGIIGIYDIIMILQSMDLD